MASSLPYTLTTIEEAIEWIECMMANACDHHDHALSQSERDRAQGKADAFRVTRLVLRDLAAERP